jgi:hypothetical protein
MNNTTLCLMFMLQYILVMYMFDWKSNYSLFLYIFALRVQFVLLRMGANSTRNM